MASSLIHSMELASVCFEQFLVTLKKLTGTINIAVKAFHVGKTLSKRNPNMVHKILFTLDCIIES